MIRVLTGENDFMRSQAVTTLIAEFDGDVERVDGDHLDAAGLADILNGQTLFASRRFVIIRQLSENKPLWDTLADKIDTVSDDTTIVLIEPTLDKRSRGYKALRTIATIQEFTPWTTYNIREAVTWVSEYAASKGVSLTEKQSALVVQRVGVDQWQLHHAIEKLSLAGPIDESIISTVIDAAPDDNVFALFETALRGDMTALEQQLAQVTSSQDPFRVFGLLSSQLLQLSALVASGGASTQNVARDIAASPYVLAKLEPYAARMSMSQIRSMLQDAAATDVQMKSIAIDPWLIVASFLQKIARQ